MPQNSHWKMQTERIVPCASRENDENDMNIFWNLILWVLHVCKHLKRNEFHFELVAVRCFMFWSSVHGHLDQVHEYSFSSYFYVSISMHLYSSISVEFAKKIVWLIWLGEDPEQKYDETLSVVFLLMKEHEYDYFFLWRLRSLLIPLFQSFVWTY